MSSLYLMQAADGTGPIYIGVAGDPIRRLQFHQSSSPVELVLLETAPGWPVHEAALHRSLWPFRVRGSWYEDCPEVRTALSEHRQVAA